MLLYTLVLIAGSALILGTTLVAIFYCLSEEQPPPAAVRDSQPSEPAIGDLEKTIRDVHAFEDRLEEFFRWASGLSMRELEIALARLGDLLDKSQDEEELRLRGIYLNTYYGLRKRNEKKQKVIQKVHGAVGLHDPIKTIVGFELKLPGFLDRQEYLSQERAEDIVRRFAP